MSEPSKHAREAAMAISDTITTLFGIPWEVRIQKAIDDAVAEAVAEVKDGVTKMEDAYGKLEARAEKAERELAELRQEQDDGYSEQQRTTS